MTNRPTVERKEIFKALNQRNRREVKTNKLKAYAKMVYLITK